MFVVLRNTVTHVCPITRHRKSAFQQYLNYAASKRAVLVK
jgi:hypothetical protein